MARLLSEVISMNREAHSPAISSISQWLRLLLGLVLVFCLFHGTASTLASDRGQAGLFIGGLFAQAGVAEETLFRGYLFGRVRLGRTFWRAAAMSMLPFVAVHLFLFLTMSWPLALASVLLAVVISFPLAHLFELGGKTIWAPAILHFVIQGAVKVVIVADGGETLFPLVWMLASALLPPLVLFVARPESS